jgi:hypothetical protein
MDKEDIKERDLVEQFGISRSEFKEIRETLASEHQLGTLWYRESSNKPEHLRTVFWTGAGLTYLRYYLEVKRQFTDIVETPKEWKPMTKGEFDKSVNNTYWAGKVVVNNYKNASCIMVEHQTGFKVLTKCKDNKQYSKGSYVLVDSKNLTHIVRTPSFKSYEKANEQAIKANSKSK